ncbi:MAG TPA: FAD-binding protein, partial [Paracoccaceae bacterium]|nr:FAD-binding protein [Paracoccaceae bacterium]
LEGHRFWNEAQGYSEAARAVMGQPQGQAWAVFDTRIAGIARQFADFQAAEAQGAVKTADTVAALAATTGLPADALTETLVAIPQGGTDAFGRSFSTPPLTPPYAAVRVTGALFHTQGGLDVTGTGRVRHQDGTLFPNLHAAGGAACGVSGTADSGYLSGNGLLSAVVLGRAAGADRIA